MSKEDIGYSNAVKIVNTRSKGRCVEVTRLIRAGQLIIKEAPFSCLPLATSTSSSINLTHSRYQLNAVEVSLAQAARQRNTKVDSVILASRCLINQHTARSKGYNNTCQLWNSLNDSNYSHNDDELVAAAEMVMRLCAMKFLNSTHDECKRALCKLSNSSFTITDHTFAECGRGIFLWTACMNHSCEPNALHHYDNEGNIIVHAARAIQPGEEIFISYIDIGKSAWWRLEQLDKYGFRCTCRRCVGHEPFEQYKCQTSDCHGHISILAKWAQSGVSKYHFWLQGEVPVSSSSSSKRNILQHDHFIFPCQPLLIQPLNSSAGGFVKACQYCKQSLQPSVIAGTMNKAQKHFVENRINECWILISKWCVPGHYLHQYCIAQLCSELETDIAMSIRNCRNLNVDTVLQYLKLLPTAIKSRSVCYQQLYPSVIMQQVYTISFTASIINYHQQARKASQKQDFDEALCRFAEFMLRNRVDILEGLGRYVGESDPLLRECLMNFEDMQRFMSI